MIHTERTSAQLYFDEYGDPVPCLKPGKCVCDDPCGRVLAALADPLSDLSVVAAQPRNASIEQMMAAVDTARAARQVREDA